MSASIAASSAAAPRFRVAATRAAVTGGVEAAAIEAAVSSALDDKVFTADLAAPGQAVSTAQAAQAVLDRLG